MGAFKDVGTLVEKFNKNLYDNETQQARKLIIKNNYIYVEGYKNDAISIINSIKSLTNEGVDNYSNAVKHWLDEQSYFNISDEKKNAMQHMFESSKVSVIYGAAGTGKTTLISCISSFFKDSLIGVSYIRYHAIIVFIICLILLRKYKLNPILVMVLAGISEVVIQIL